MKLPFCDGGSEYPDYPDVETLRDKVKTADGLILATPEYHGSMSGVLKNALELMSFEHLSGKVTGLISVLGGQSNSNALNDLRIVVRWVHGWVIPSLNRYTGMNMSRYTDPIFKLYKHYEIRLKQSSLLLQGKHPETG